MAYDKLRETKALVMDAGVSCDIEVDGGVSLQNLESILEAGANVIVAGSAIFKNDIAKNVKDFRSIMK